MIATIHGAYLGLILRSAAALGLPMAPWRTRLGLEGSEDVRVPVETTYELWTALVTLSKDPAIGLRLARHALGFSAGPLEYVARNCPTVGALLQTIAQYARLLNTGADIAIDTHAQGATIRYRLLTRHPVHPASTDFVVGYLLLRARGLSGRRLMPARIELPQAKPQNLRPYKSLLGKSLRWQQPGVQVHFSQPQWDMPLQAPDPELARLMRDVVERELDQLPDDDLVTRVEFEILRGGGQTPRTLEDVARRLGMTARTLQRRLSDAQTSFRAVSKQARMGRAADLVRAGLLPLDEIAYEVGFSELSTFCRAFRRAYGTTPTQYRAEAL
jgi:AraC-like DNA-binding protein